MTESQPAGPPAETGYVDVNGLHMYYESYGDRSPLVLLHGGMLTIDLNFATLIPTLATQHRVIGVEMQGHGRTADIDREITPAALASDVIALLDHIGVERAHVFGHSMGGAATLELGVNSPDRVRSLVAASASVRPDGLHEDPPRRTSPTSPRPTGDSRRIRSASRPSSPPCPPTMPTPGAGQINSSPASLRPPSSSSATETSPPSNTAHS